ncbi:hypothetical protein J2S74_000437 [Evansella vedderi]|uniref:NADH dehydrogenase subunit 2 n=1 Tax=Evansella vedderi TaxID=38282 RepID=A0ABT9ZP97_9BACI|nr:hypothetical protein [Evansella vedderi]
MFTLPIPNHTLLLFTSVVMNGSMTNLYNY